MSWRETLSSISPAELYGRLGTASAPAVIDVRRLADFATADELIVSAYHRDPDEVEKWRKDLPRGRQVVVHCVYGHEVSQGVATALRAAGVDAVYLQDGIAGWTAKGLPTHRTISATPGKWVTRERPKIDRIACPWLIRRFIDPQAEFIYVPTKDVLDVAKATGGTPYDIEGVEFAHEGERCSFDTIVRIYGHQGCPPQPSRENRARRRYLASRSHAAVRRPVRDLARPLRELSQRSRNARARHG